MSPTEESAVPGRVHFAYRVAFACAVALFALLFIAGGTRGILTGGRPPGLAQDMLAGGAQALSRGNARWAAREYRMATILTPSDYHTLLQAANGLSRAGDRQGALAALDRAASLRPPSADLDTARGRVLFLDHQNELAWAAFLRAVQKDPKHAGGLAGLGDILLDQERYAEAIRFLERSVEREPDQAEVHNSLGIAYALSGAPERAVSHFSRAAALAPSADAVANLARVQAAAATRSPQVRP